MISATTDPSSWLLCRSMVSLGDIWRRYATNHIPHLMDVICFTTSAGEWRSMSLL